MKALSRINTLFTALLVTACMQSGAVMSSDEPQWLQAEPDMYPDARYMSATGAASEPEQAKARALSNLAKIFEVQVREVSTTTSDIQTHQSDGEESVQKSQRINSAVNLHTDKMIQGARIAEQWRNSDDLTWYALAVLDRTQAGNNIRGEMNRLDEETQYALNQQAKRNDPLLQIADLQKANQLQRDRLTLQRTLKIIDVRGRGVPAQWNLAELHERLQQALRALPIRVVVKRDDIGGLESILQGAAASAGFAVGSSGYQLAASLEAQPPITKDNWHWLRGTLKLQLISPDGVTVLGHQSWPLKVSGGNPAQLNTRLMKAAEEKLKLELLNSVLDFAS